MRKNLIQVLTLFEFIFLLNFNTSILLPNSVSAVGAVQDIYLVVKPDFGGHGFYAFYPQVIVVQQGSQVNITVRNLADETYHLKIGDFVSTTIKPGVSDGASVSPVDTNVAIFSPSKAGIFTVTTEERSELVGQFVVLPSDWASYNPTPVDRSYTQIVKPDFAGDMYDKFISGILVANLGDKLSISIRNTDDAPHGFALAGYGINSDLTSGTDLNNGTIMPSTTKIPSFTASTPGIFWFECTIYCGHGHIFMTGTLIVLPNGSSGYNPVPITDYSYITVKPDYAGDGYDKFVPGVMFLNQDDFAYTLIRNTDTHKHGFSLPSYNIQNITINGANQTTQTPSDTFIPVFKASQPGVFEFHCTIHCGPGHPEMIGYFVVLPRFNATQNTIPAEVLTGEEYFEGEKAFQNGGPSCRSCHRIGVLNITGGTDGPDLSTVLKSRFNGNVTNLKDFLQDPTTPTMASVWDNKPLTSQEINALAVLSQYAYQQTLPKPSPTPTTTPTPTPSPTSSPGPTSSPNQTEVTEGEKYFEGKTAFKNGGPPCYSCHKVSVLNISGASVGPDLSKALNFTEQPAGYSGPLVKFDGNVTKLKDFLHNPTTSVMKSTWNNSPLTTQEVNALSALIQDAYSKASSTPTPSPTPIPSPSPTPPAVVPSRFTLMTFVFLSVGMILAGIVIGLIAIPRVVKSDEEK